MARSRRITLGSGRTVSDGTYYKMRRQYAAAGGDVKQFDRLARRTPGGYTAANTFSRVKRLAGRVKAAGRDTRKAVADIVGAIEDLGPDIEVKYGTP